MSPTLQQFRQIANSQNSQVLQSRGQQQQLGVLGRFKHHQVQSLNGALSKKLSSTELESNQAVKQQFAKVLTKNFDGLFVLSALQQIGLHSDRPLTTKDVADILAKGKRFQLLSPNQVQQHLSGNTFRDQVLHIEKTIRADKGYFNQPLPQKLPLNLHPIPDLVRQNLRNLKTPVTRALLDTIVQRVVKKHLNGTSPDLMVRDPNPRPPLRLPTLPKTTVSTPKPMKTNAGKTIKGLVKLPKLKSQKQSFGWNSVVSTFKSGNSKAAYFDKVKIGHKGKEFLPITREWALNFTALRSQLDNPNLTAPQRKMITSRALGYLYKFAEVGNPVQMGWQANQLNPTGSNYFRQGQSQLFTLFKAELEAGLGLPKGTGYPVFDRKALDQVKRNFEFAAKDKQVFEINDISGPSVFQNIAAAALKTRGKFFLDISPLINKIQVPNGLGSEQAAAVGGQIEDIVGQVRDKIRLQVEIQVRQNNPKNTPLREIDIQTREIMRTIMDHTALGGTVRVGDQDVLIMRGFDRGGNAAAQAVAKDMMYHSGYLLGPTHILESWATLAPSMESMLNRLGQDISDLNLPDVVDFPTPDYHLQSYDGMDAFFNDPQVAGFFKTTMHGGAPNYAQALVPLVSRQMEALKKTIIPLLKDPHLGGMAQFVLNRMAGHMEKATNSVNNMPAFLNQMHLINEELATLVALIKPYNPDHFSALYEKAAGINPHGVKVKPHHQFKNGGMHAFNAVLSGVEQLTGRRDLNVVAVKGSYYEESDHVLSETAHYSKSTFDSSDPKTSIQNIRSSLKNGQKLDLFLGEFHHNISASVKNRYKGENLVAQVKELYQQGLVSDTFTVAIDTTIAKTDGPEIKQFLEAFADKINKRELNVVFFRSGQKFDMGGNDNYNAGFMVSYNRDQQFQGFNQGSANIGNPSEGNLQGMMHIELTAQKELNNYRKAIMSSHAKLLDPNSKLALSERLRDPKQVTGNESLLITPNDDLENTVFLDIRSPILNKIPKATGQMAVDPHVAVKSLIETTATSRGLSFGGRASFGFAHTNTAVIGGQNFRLTLGALTDKEIAGWGQIFEDFRAVGDIAAGLLKDPKDFHNFVRTTSSNMLNFHRNLANAKKKYAFAGSLEQGNLNVKVTQNMDHKDLLNLATLWKSAGVPQAAEAFLNVLESVNKGDKFKLASTIHKMRLELVTEYAGKGHMEHAARLLGQTKMDPALLSQTAVAALKARTRHNAPLSLAEKQAYAQLINYAGTVKNGMVAAFPHLARLVERELEQDTKWAAVQIQDMVVNHAKRQNDGTSIRAMELALAVVAKTGDLEGRKAVFGFLASEVKNGNMKKVDALLRQTLLSLNQPRPSLKLAQSQYQSLLKQLPADMAANNPLFHMVMVDNIAVAAIKEGNPQEAVRVIAKLVQEQNLADPGLKREFSKRMVAVLDQLVQHHPSQVNPLLRALGNSAHPMLGPNTDSDTVKRVMHHIAGNFATAGGLYNPLLNAMVNAVSKDNLADINKDLKALIAANQNHFNQNRNLILPMQDKVVNKALEHSDYRTYLDGVEQRMRMELNQQPLLAHRDVLKAILPHAMNNLAMDASFIENIMGRTPSDSDPSPLTAVMAELASQALSIGRDAEAQTLISLIMLEPAGAVAKTAKTITGLFEQIRGRDNGPYNLLTNHHFGVTTTLIQQVAQRASQAYGPDDLARYRDQLINLEKLVAMDPGKNGKIFGQLMLNAYFAIAEKAATFQDGANLVVEMFDRAAKNLPKELQVDFGSLSVRLAKTISQNQRPDLAHLIQQKAHQVTN
ncbi:hypothetical protein [Acanthopleuribacter pedis]|uniref:Uncharacterized protein n=1 Tax=Acanthopleuribacter pedis TaxID=442870 RepID=A0A8J7U4F3_9BACT|nr:hypothetical protein [Acanthopleuribacter pedis]MBO1321423.1 hypothetical protein [Acanthopleuribacter pedis]